MAIGTMPTRPALLVKLVDRDGCIGWGEVWANFPSRSNIHKAHVIEDVIVPVLLRQSFTDPSEIQALLRDRLTVYFLHVGQLVVFEHILAGLDIALWDLALRKANSTFASHFNLANTWVPTYASSINHTDLERLIPIHAQLGQRQFKLKVGFQDDGGKALLERAAALCPTDGQLMIDSNQSWSLSEALDTLRALEPFDLKFVEEPIPANSPLTDWEHLARASAIPLAAGENVYGVDSFQRLGDAGVTYLQPDVAKWGGISGALQLASCLPAGASLWPHFMGTAIGQIAALSLTSYIGTGSVCELDVNPNPLRTELCGNALGIHNGCISLKPDSGLVYAPLADQINGLREQA